MNRRITLIVIIVAALGIFSVTMIARYRRPPSSTDSLSGDAMTDRRETATATPEREAALGKRLAGPTPSAEEVTRRRRKSETETAIERAASAGKYAFVFFYSDDGEQTQSMRKVFKSAMGNMANRSVALEVNVSDRREWFLVERFSVSRAPMPLVLAVAPNGAITGGFSLEFEEKQLLEAFASPCMEKSLKALQDSRLVLVCIQNANTTSNDIAMKGVQDLKADPGFGSFTEIVALDPADPSESEFLTVLQVDPQTTEAVTVCLLPPGRSIAKFTGGTDKEMIVAALASSKGCGPGGCGPGGCGQ